MSMLNTLKRVLTPDSQLYPVPDKAVWNSPMIPAHTPDMCILEEYQFQNMFVYGNMMRNMPHHDNIGDGSSFLAQAFTVRPFKVYKKVLGKESYPIAIEASEHDRRAATLKGELFKVRPQQFAVIDKIMENGVLFERRRIRILVPTNKITIIRKKEFMKIPELIEHQDVYELRAWTYIGTDFWNDMLADPVGLYKPASYLLPPLQIFQPNNKRLKPYYHFTPNDLNGT